MWIKLQNRQASNPVIKCRSGSQIRKGQHKFVMGKNGTVPTHTCWMMGESGMYHTSLHYQGTRLGMTGQAGDCGRSAPQWGKKAGFRQAKKHIWFRVRVRALSQMVSQITVEEWRGKTCLRQVTGDQCRWTAGVWSSRWEESGWWAECRSAQPSLRQADWH